MRTYAVGRDNLLDYHWHKPHAQMIQQRKLCSYRAFVANDTATLSHIGYRNPDTTARASVVCEYTHAAMSGDHILLLRKPRQID